MPILILGGGIAGLAAAKTLVDQGHEVIIIEARDRLGGRIDTTKLSDGKTIVERGANWVEAVGNNPVLAGKNLQTFPTDYKKFTLYKDGEEVEPESEEIFGVDNLIFHFMDKKYRDVSQLKDKSVADIFEEFFASPNSKHFAEHKAMMKEMLRLLITSDDPLELEKLGAAHFHSRRTRAGQAVAGLKPIEEIPLLVINGYNRVVEDLKKYLEKSGKATIYLQHTITDISASQNTSSITCVHHGQQIKFAGQGVVCALPVSVMQQLMQKNAIHPPLPARHQEGLAAMQMGVMNKVILQFEKQFWDSTHFIGWFDGENAVTAVNQNAANKGSNLLVVYYTGERAKFKSDDTAVIKQTIDELKQIYGDAAVTTKLQSSLVTRWHEDPFAQGSYSVMPVKATVTARSDASQPIADRQMVFAGEHVAHYPGTVHGAFVSGQQAANQLVAMLTPENNSKPSAPSRGM